jgi:hypothetical protein
LAKAPRKSKQQQLPAENVPRPASHLKKEELDRVDELRINMVKSKGQTGPDVQSTLELMYLRVLGRVKNRTAMDSDLKALKKTLDQAAAQITEILENSDGSASPSKSVRTRKK